jgi:hypothetical protein
MRSIRRLAVHRRLADPRVARAVVHRRGGAAIFLVSPVSSCSSFRDPDRPITKDADAVLSPADGA